MYTTICRFSVGHRNEVISWDTADGRCLNGDFETFLFIFEFEQSRVVRAIRFSKSIFGPSTCPKDVALSMRNVSTLVKTKCLVDIIIVYF